MDKCKCTKPAFFLLHSTKEKKNDMREKIMTEFPFWVNFNIKYLDLLTIKLLIKIR